MVAVIGTKDLIPPQGRVGVELYNPDTGRVKKKVQAENAIMDWATEQIALNQGRGTGQFRGRSGNQTYQPGISTTGSLIQASQLPQPSFGFQTEINGNLVDQPGAWPWRVPPGACYQWLWGTPSSVAPDATRRHIPVTSDVADVTGGVYLAADFAADGIQNTRGYLDLAASAHGGRSGLARCSRTSRAAA